MADDPNCNLTFDEYFKRFTETATYIGLNSQFIEREKDRYESLKDQFHPLWFHNGVEDDIVGSMWLRFCELFYDEAKNDLRLEVDLYGLKFDTFLSQMGWTHKRARQIAKFYRPTSPEQYLIVAIREIDRSVAKMWHESRQRYLSEHPDAKRFPFDTPNWVYPYQVLALDKFRRTHSYQFEMYLAGRYGPPPECM